MFNKYGIPDKKLAEQIEEIAGFFEEVLWELINGKEGAYPTDLRAVEQLMVQQINQTASQVRLLLCKAIKGRAEKLNAEVNAWIDEHKEERVRVQV